jgi:predicted metal-dependent HD superfamily phosphohydrolase
MDAQLHTDLAGRLSFDCPASLPRNVFARYSEPHRRYHTWAHVLACLDARREITDASLPEVDLALLFHDAVYDPLASDNEDRSAGLLVEEGRRAWLSEQLVQRAQVLVRATQYGGDDVFDTEEACVVVDADLSILGSDAASFAEYERLVRQEFAAFDDAAYASGRSRVLRAFLERPAIYSTRRGLRLCEARARRNLEGSLATLAQ